MNASELALKMLEWEEKKKELDVLENEISQAVLKLGKTQNVGNVRATFSTGKRNFDYRRAWAQYGYGTGVNIEDFKEVKYNYGAACKEAGIKDIPVESQGKPSVSIKLLEDK